jgi:hypothetical protein
MYTPQQQVVPPAPAPPPARIPVCSCFLFCATCVICTALASLAYFGAHAPPGTDASAKFADASCSWNQAALSGNLLLLLTCLHPRFSSRDTAVQKGPSTTGSSSGCSGPLIDDWFEKHRLGSGLDFGGAQQLAESVGKRLRKRDECSGEWSHPLHVCFRHASTKAALDRTETSKFVGCLLGDETMQCRETVCA